MSLAKANVDCSEGKRKKVQCVRLCYFINPCSEMWVQNFSYSTEPLREFLKVYRSCLLKCSSAPMALAAWNNTTDTLKLKLGSLFLIKHLLQFSHCMRIRVTTGLCHWAQLLSTCIVTADV